MRLLSGTWLVWRHALLTGLRGKRVIVLLLLAALPLLLAALNVSHSRNVSPTDFGEMFLLVICQVTIPFAALFLGIGVLGDEIDGRTITFLFTRPLPRAAFYLGRLLGFASAFGVVLALSTLAFTGIYGRRVELSGTEITGTVAIALAGFFVYIAFFAALRALTKKALYVGFLITFVFELVLSKLPVGALAKLSVWHHFTVLLSYLFEGRALRLPVAQPLAAGETAGGSLWVLACVLGISLACGAWIVKTREIHVPAAAA